MINKLKLRHFIVVYPSLWIIYCIFELMSGNIKNLYSIVMNLIPALLLCIISYLFYLYYKKSIFLKTKGLIFSVSSLFLIDQISKIVVSSIFKAKNISTFKVIPNYFYITPYINDKGSFVASRFNIDAPFIIFTIFNFLILLLIFWIYKFKLHKKQINSIEQISFIFLFSGGLCSFIDKVFWGGSLDFLHVNNLFIADIKDIFITLGLASFILSSIISNDQINLKEFLNFTFKSKISK